MKTIQIACASFGILLLAACSKEEPAPQGGMIGFDARVQPAKEQLAAQSRSASLVEGATFSVGDQIGVLGFACPSGTWAGTETPSLMYNSELTKLADANFRYSPMIAWPSLGKVRFFAYYPYSGAAAEGAVGLSPATHSGYPSVTVVLGKNSDPVDFMTAQQGPVGSADLTNAGLVNFTFKHRLAKIYFQACAIGIGTDVKLYLNTLRIRNVYNKGVYTFTDTDGGWSGLGNEKTPDAVSGATLKLDATARPIENDTYIDLLTVMNTEAYVLMLPQVYEDTEMEIGYTLEYLKSAGGCEYHISGTKTIPMTVDWAMGGVYTYRFQIAFHEVSGIDVQVSVLKDLGNSEWDGGRDIPTEMN